MTSSSERDEVMETPWEFLPGDDEVDSYDDGGLCSEEAAMHIESKRIPRVIGQAEQLTVHYLDDEEPELPDRSVKPKKVKDLPAVTDLLTRQHYLPPETP
ncbi:MAG: hypothetical protein R2706_11695 [Acidimicrobiales bacterium]